MARNNFFVYCWKLDIMWQDLSGMFIILFWAVRVTDERGKPVRSADLLFIFPFLKSKSWRNEACLDHMCFSGKHIHCSGWEVEGLFLCISVFSCRSTLLAHGESPFVWNIPYCISPLGIRTKPSNLVGWRIICGEETSWYFPEMCYVRESVSQMPLKSCNARGQALRLTCPGTVSYPTLSLTNCVHLAAIFSKTLTQWCYADVNSFPVWPRDYGDSMLAGQP